ncbi:nickel pincer cofactor biosynthesis protein LarC [Thalassorhabdus alkalitolerans]|uniref:Pyridinium-3,5-bisthiocarboxylic acid mononucleotide nickel insertion protein n=1 Tax=Thalassorhabdus alkalitolerans TaxID=2282697 RepID=A0ABW0YQY2_9BACI
MKTLYLDCVSGISGDMTLSALIDAGASLQYVKQELKKLPIGEFDLTIKRVNKCGISSSLLDISLSQELEHHDHHHAHDHKDHHAHSHRHASHILKMIQESSLSERVKEQSTKVFEAIAAAEGKIHGIPPEKVHFHEVGAMDSIIDIIGVCVALEDLEIETIYSSPVPTGTGLIKIDHGIYPVPAPATAELLKGIPISPLEAKGELTTPTGAGFIHALVSEVRSLPPYVISSIGYGAGKKDFDSHPNILRAIMLESQEERITEEVVLLECQIDDLPGEVLGYVMESLFEAGALDVYYTPIQMKKNRPGTLITVLSKQEQANRLEELLLQETSTFGVRSSLWQRRALSRSISHIDTIYGDIRIKNGYEKNKVYQRSPEFEDIKQAALHHGVPLKKVLAEIYRQLDKY